LQVPAIQAVYMVRVLLVVPPNYHSVSQRPFPSSPLFLWLKIQAIKGKKEIINSFPSSKKRKRKKKEKKEKKKKE
jgi:hypothetical protein